MCVKTSSPPPSPAQTKRPHSLQPLGVSCLPALAFLWPPQQGSPQAGVHLVWLRFYQHGRTVRLVICQAVLQHVYPTAVFVVADH